MKTGQGFILVYSITSPTSFEAATKFRDQILKMKNAQEVCFIPSFISLAKTSLTQINITLHP